MVLPTFLFFSPSFLAALRHMELLGQGSELSCSLELSHRCCDARFLMHCAGLGIELHPSASQDAANPIVPQWELLSSHPEFAFFFMLVPQPGPYLLCLLMGALPDWSFHDIEPWLENSSIGHFPAGSGQEDSGQIPSFPVTVKEWQLHHSKLN